MDPTSKKYMLSKLEIYRNLGASFQANQMFVHVLGFLGFTPSHFSGVHTLMRPAQGSQI